MSREFVVRASRRPDAVGLALVFCAFAALIVFIGPVREFPIEDDWDYSKTVLNLLQTGVFHRLEVTQATVFFPAVWGALFSTIFGYSFATLRISTLVLAFGALLWFYALLRELEFDVARSTLATLTLMVAPAFTYLAFSFMTDVPFFFGFVGALYGYVRAIRRDDVRWAVVGSAFAALAFLARQVGAVMPLAFGLFVFARADVTPLWNLWARIRASVKWISAAAAIPLLTVGAYFAWTQWLGGGNWADRTRTVSGTLGFWLQPDFVGVMRRRYVIATATLGVYMLPLWAAGIHMLPSSWRGIVASTRWRKLIGGIVVIAFVVTLAQLALHDEWFPYLTDILTRRGLRPYLAYFAYNMDAHRPFVLSLEAAAALTMIAGALGIAQSLVIVARLRARAPGALMLVYVTTLVVAAFSLTFFTYFERYLLPLLPGAIILLLDATRRARFACRAGLIAFVVVAVASIALMRDYFAWNEVKWDAGRVLLAQGVPVTQIDGGYEWDGWYLYDASAAYIRDHNVSMTIDPWQYVLDPEYIFAFQPPPRYRVVQELQFVTPLRAGQSDRIYLLRREP